MDSIRLSADWDLDLTSGGNLPTVSGAERVAQDVACYVRTWQGECWYQAEDGIPYLVDELATLPPKELVIERAMERALEVPNVLTAEVTLTEFADRVLKGDIQVTTDDGETVNVNID